MYPAPLPPQRRVPQPNPSLGPVAVISGVLGQLALVASLPDLWIYWSANALHPVNWQLLLMWPALSVVAVVTGSLGLSHYRSVDPSARSSAKAGLVIGIAGLTILTVAVLFLVVAVAVSFNSGW